MLQHNRSQLLRECADKGPALRRSPRCNNAFVPGQAPPRALRPFSCACSGGAFLLRRTPRPAAASTKAHPYCPMPPWKSCAGGTAAPQTRREAPGHRMSLASTPAGAASRHTPPTPGKKSATLLRTVTPTVLPLTFHCIVMPGRTVGSTAGRGHGWAPLAAPARPRRTVCRSTKGAGAAVNVVSK